MFEFEVFRKQIHCMEESTYDIVWTFWRPRNHSALPVVIRRREIMPPLPPSLWPCDRINVSWFCKVLKKMKQLLCQTKTSFLNFRPKLDDCMFKVFSWHCKCLHEYYSSIMLCNRCQNSSFCDSLCSNFFSCFFHVFVLPKDVSKTTGVDKR